jgi:hypothetical protein
VKELRARSACKSAGIQPWRGPRAIPKAFGKAQTLLNQWLSSGMDRERIYHRPLPRSFRSRHGADDANLSRNGGGKRSIIASMRAHSARILASTMGSQRVLLSTTLSIISARSSSASKTALAYGILAIVGHNWLLHSLLIRCFMATIKHFRLGPGRLEKLPHGAGLLLSDELAIAKLLVGWRTRPHHARDRSERVTPMSGPALMPRVARLGDGRYRAEVVIADLWGGESVFCGHTAPSHAEALEAARRLVAAATVVEPAIFELPPAWK